MLSNASGANNFASAEFSKRWLFCFSEYRMPFLVKTFISHLIPTFQQRQKSLHKLLKRQSGFRNCTRQVSDSAGRLYPEKLIGRTNFARHFQGNMPALLCHFDRLQFVADFICRQINDAGGRPGNTKFVAAMKLLRFNDKLCHTDF